MNILGMKIWLLRLLALLPGSVGQSFDTKLLWQLRLVRGDTTLLAFEDALSNLSEGSICVDLGANIGTISERFYEAGARVYCYEPDPWAFEQLSNRFKNRNRVTLNKAAVGAENGTVELMRDPEFGPGKEFVTQGSSIVQRSLLWGASEPEKFTVSLIDIRELLRSLPGRVEILKVDIEGAEVELLEVLLDSPEINLVEYMFVETHEAQMPEIRERVKDLRLRVAEIEEPKIFLDWV